MSSPPPPSYPAFHLIIIPAIIAPRQPCQLLADPRPCQQIEHFFPIGTVKALDVSVLVRFAGLDVLNEHPDGFCPGHKVATQELGAIIGSQYIGQATLSAQPFKHSDKPPSGDRGVDLDRPALPVEVVNDVKGLEPVAGMQGIAHEVGRPDLVRMLRHQ